MPDPLLPKSLEARHVPVAARAAAFDILLLLPGKLVSLFVSWTEFAAAALVCYGSFLFSPLRLSLSAQNTNSNSSTLP